MRCSRYTASLIVAIFLLVGLLAFLGADDATGQEDAAAYRAQAQRERDDAQVARQHAQQWHDLADKARVRLHGASPVMQQILESQIAQDENEAAQEMSRADELEQRARDFDQKAQEASGGAGDAQGQTAAPGEAAAGAAPEQTEVPTEAAGGAAGETPSAGQASPEAATTSTAAEEEPSGMDSCLIGTWECIDFKLTDAKYFTGGGTGFRVTFKRDGTEVVDYSSMQAVMLGTDYLAYTGSARAKISAKDGAASVETMLNAGAVMTLHSVQVVHTWPNLPDLGPGGLGTAQGNSNYTCTEDSLEYHASAARDHRPNVALKFRKISSSKTAGGGETVSPPSERVPRPRPPTTVAKAPPERAFERTPSPTTVPKESRERTLERTPSPTTVPKESPERTPVPTPTASPTHGGVPHREETPRETPTPGIPRDLGPPEVYVPGETVKAPPQCCVISSITVTNTQNVGLFFLFNQEFRTGMKLSEDHYVKPGESRTFTGDFGPCVDIRAFAGTTSPEGVKQTGNFDHERICCKDLLSGHGQGKYFSFSLNKIEWREWRDCPENPPEIGKPPEKVIRPTRTPTRTRTATRTPTPTQTATETPTATPSAAPEGPHVEEPPVPVTPPPGEAAQCPQRGKGCAALVIDFFKVEADREVQQYSNDTHLRPQDREYFVELHRDKLDDAVKRLEEMNCKMVKVYPDFWRHPPPITVHVNGVDIVIDPLTDANQEVTDHNTEEWRKVRAADVEHLDDLRRDWEIVFEIVAAHGGRRHRLIEDNSCGSWGQDFEADGSLNRWPFHRDHYRQLKRHVCDWVVYDSSCFSGLTPQAIDGLENANQEECSGEPLVDCPKHAGYEGDLATGTAPTTETCIALDTWIQFDHFSSALNMSIEGSRGYGNMLDNLAGVLGAMPTRKAGATPEPDAFKPSFYLDKGYHGDQPPPPKHPRKYLYPRPPTAAPR